MPPIRVRENLATRFHAMYARPCDRAAVGLFRSLLKGELNMGIEMEESTAQVLAVFLMALALLMFALIGGDGTDIAEHDAWMQQLKEQGAWVMW